MAPEQIRVEKRGRVGIAWLNRPEKLNAWTNQLHAELRGQIADWNADPSIGAILLAGEGRAFCAGADIGGWAQDLQVDDEGDSPLRTREDWANWPTLLRRSKPIVAALHGYAIGVGLTMVLPCDVRIAAEGTKLSIRFIRVGLVPELGSTRLLAQIAGLGHAAEMCLSGRLVDAAEAHQMGLVNQVVPADELFDVALAKAEELASGPTNVALLIKELIALNQSESDLDTVMERETFRIGMARQAPAHAEAVQAFMEKREPEFNS